MSTISERATGVRPQRRERPQPQYIARAKVGNGWVTIGACWPLRSGDEGFSLKLTTIPLNWDGRFVLLPPLPNEAPEDEPPEEPVVPMRSRRGKREEDNIPV
jgi:hypothetical protein